MNFSCVAAMLRSTLADGLITQRAALKYIGERFRLKAELPEWTSDEDIARYLLKCVSGFAPSEELGIYPHSAPPPLPPSLPPSLHPRSPPPPPSFLSLIVPTES